MTETAINNFELLSNETIRQIYKDKLIEKSQLQEKWSKSMYFSRIMRSIALCFVAISMIVAWYKTYQTTDKWYWITLNIVSAIAIATLVIGALFLILKPVFYFIRRRSKSLHNTITHIESEMLALELCLITKNIPSLKPKLTQQDYAKLNERTDFKTLVKKYKEAIAETYECEKDFRIRSMNCAFISEWQWVAAAGTVIMAVIAIIVFFIGFMVFLALMVAYIAFIILTVKQTRYYYRPREEYNYDPSYDKEKEGLWTTTLGKVFDGGLLIFDILDCTSDYKKSSKRIQREKSEWHKRILAFGNYDININDNLEIKNEN